MTRIRPPLMTPPRLAMALASIAGLCGCAGMGSGNSTQSDALAHLSTGHSQVIAWVPRQQAQTASVAEATAYIALTRAKQAVEAELCHGTWMFSGHLEQETAPQPATAPDHLGGFRGWQVRVSWDPQLAECGVSAQSYALNLSKHLPGWMMIQTSQPLALYHQGVALYQQDNMPLFALAQRDTL